MKADQLAVVQGWPHTVVTLRRWTRDAVARARRVGARLAARHRRRCSARRGSWPPTRSPTPTHHSYPGITGPATVARLRATSSAATSPCSRCTRWRAWRASWPAGSRPGEQRSRTADATPARWRSSSSTAATLFSLLTQANALGHVGADLAHQLGVAPARADARDPPARACPSCSRSSCRSPPGRSPARRGAWHELLAATLATTAIAIPLIVFAAVDRDLRNAGPPRSRLHWR